MTQASDEAGFRARWQTFFAGRDHDMALTLGLEPISGNPEQVVLRMALSPAIAQPAGLFSAASLFGLADICGTFLAMQHLPPGQFPLAVQSSLNLVSNVRAGSATSTSSLVRSGRRMIVTSSEVRSDEGDLLALVTTTYVPNG